MNEDIAIMIATLDDLAELEIIRQAAFNPVFESFENILGNTVYHYAQKPEDSNQKELLKDIFNEQSEWSVYVIKLSSKIVGFISIKTDEQNLVGEIGLNAIHPDYSNRGLGTKMYEFAIREMKDKGMKVATVATGGDPSHAPARRAYEKAGFDIQIPSVWYCKEL